MTREENYFRAVDFRRPQCIPLRGGVMPATWARHREALEEIVLAHPAVFGAYEKGSTEFDRFEGTYRAGEFIDPWGCVWKNVAPGLEGVVVGHPLPRREDVHTLRPPAQPTGFPHGFMFMRLYYLRGYEELMIDFAEEPPELQMLIDAVLAHNLRELEAALALSPPMLIFGDDLGNQDGLPIDPRLWRKYLKPCYQQLFGRCREAGTRVYFHSDGRIVDIIGDLIDCGVTVLNPQVGANGLADLARVAKGRVAIDLDLDRQQFPFWTAAQIDAHVHQAVQALYAPEGGLLLYAEFEPDLSLATIEAICLALEKHQNYRDATGATHAGHAAPDHSINS